MTNELKGDLIICDPSTVPSDVNPILVLNTGVGTCFMTVHPVDDYRDYSSGREFYVKEKVIKAFSGILPRCVGNLGTDSGKIGIFPGEKIDRSTLVKGENFKIRNFKGRLGYLYDEKGMLHLYGAGNYNFYTL